MENRWKSATALKNSLTATATSTLASVLSAVATVAGAVSGGTYFYSKWKRGRNEQDAPDRTT